MNGRCLVAISTERIEQINLNKPINPLIFSIEQVQKATKELSNKKSYGVDTIPQNLVKDGAEILLPTYHNLVNMFCQHGLPEELKVARVIPLYKKGSKQEITNYRPISNLSSISKMYEKCILSRLNEELKGQEGSHQHGFRKYHSTETALIQLQASMAKILENDDTGCVYSVDLSAAFDLLRPDKFYHLFKNKMTEGLLFCIMDFLQNRKFQIDLDNVKSPIFELDRGCVQGSILGPKLFTLYLGELQSVIGPDVGLVSYADDTYVTILGKSEIDVMKKAESTIQKHIEFLRTMGMVVNESKTEVMWIGTRNPPKPTLAVNGTECKFVDCIKALGIYIDKTLSWDDQANHAINKGKSLLSHFKFLRKYFNEKQYLKIVTGNYYSTVFYGSTVWFDNIKSIHKTKLNSMHFRLLRVACRDFQNLISKEDLTKRCQRAAPRQWVNFLTSSKIIKICRNKEPPDIYEMLMSTVYNEPRKPNIGYFFDDSRKKPGKQRICNRLAMMKEVKKPWLHQQLTDDEIRIEMKRTFFKF